MSKHREEMDRKEEQQKEKMERIQKLHEQKVEEYKEKLNSIKHEMCRVQAAYESETLANQ